MFGLRQRAQHAAAQPAPPPRETPKVHAQLVIDQRTGNLELLPLVGAGLPIADQCGVLKGSTLSPVPGIPGRYTAAFPAFKGRECELVFFTIADKKIETRVVYDVRDVPTITFDVSNPHLKQVHFDLVCKVRAPRP